jgi:hypothetical protein
MYMHFYIYGRALGVVAVPCTYVFFMYTAYMYMYFYVYGVYVYAFICIQRCLAGNYGAVT